MARSSPHVCTTAVPGGACLTVAIGSGRHQVRGSATVLRQAVCLQLYGGEAPHVGAVALAQMGQGAHPGIAPRASTSVLAVPGHREDVLARPLAELLATTLNRTAVVVAGMHVHAATRADIAALVRNARRVARVLAAHVLGGAPDPRRRRPHSIRVRHSSHA